MQVKIELTFDSPAQAVAYLNGLAPPYASPQASVPQVQAPVTVAVSPPPITAAQGIPAMPGMPGVSAGPTPAVAAAPASAPAAAPSTPPAAANGAFPSEDAVREAAKGWMARHGADVAGMRAIVVKHGGSNGQQVNPKFVPEANRAACIAEFGT